MMQGASELLMLGFGSFVCLAVVSLLLGRAVRIAMKHRETSVEVLFCGSGADRASDK